MAVHEDFDPRDMRCWYQMFSAVAGLGAIGLDSRHGFGEDSAPLSPLRLGCLPVRVPGGQPPSSQHGVDQQACAQQDEADGQGG